MHARVFGRTGGGRASHSARRPTLQLARRRALVWGEGGRRFHSAKVAVADWLFVASVGRWGSGRRTDRRCPTACARIEEGAGAPCSAVTHSEVPRKSQWNHREVPRKSGAQRRIQVWYASVTWQTIGMRLHQGRCHNAGANAGRALAYHTARRCHNAGASAGRALAFHTARARPSLPLCNACTGSTWYLQPTLEVVQQLLCGSQWWVGRCSDSSQR
eukprot:241699-Chlamydomonas_euryale.AAC.5